MTHARDTGGGTTRTAKLRMRRAQSVVVLVALAVPLVRGFGRLAVPPPAACPEVPIAVDLARDPPWRLTLLPGVGIQRALDIVEDRERNGPLPSLDALARIHAIGPVTVDRLRRARTVRVLLAGRPVGCPP